MKATEKRGQLSIDFLSKAPLERLADAARTFVGFDAGSEKPGNANLDRPVKPGKLTLGPDAKPSLPAHAA